MVNRPTFYGAKRAILGEVVTEVKAHGRGLHLSKDWSRAVKQGDIHEIMVTKSLINPGEELKEFTAVAFFEAYQGSHSVIGDILYLNEKELGTLVGYEMNHMPNHMNMVFIVTGDPPDFKLGDKIRIQ